MKIPKNLRNLGLWLQLMLESSQPESTISMKPLGEYTPNEKGWWRAYTDKPDQFFRDCNIQFDPTYMTIPVKNNLENFLIEASEEALDTIRMRIETDKSNPDREFIDWSQLDLSATRETKKTHLRLMTILFSVGVMS